MSRLPRARGVILLDDGPNGGNPRTKITREEFAEMVASLNPGPLKDKMELWLSKLTD